MQQATNLIIDHSSEFPEFRYYIRLIKKAERNITTHPDICVETCKSLLEGVAKVIILKLDNTVTRKDLDGGRNQVEALVKTAANLLKQHDDVVEDDFIKRCGSFAYSLRTLRNERGDISHGKAALKLVESSDHLAKITLQVTDGLLCYLLTEFFRVIEEMSSRKLQSHVSPLPYAMKTTLNLTIGWMSNIPTGQGYPQQSLV